MLLQPFIQMGLSGSFSCKSSRERSFVGQGHQTALKEGVEAAAKKGAKEAVEEGTEKAESKEGLEAASKRTTAEVMNNSLT